MSKYIWERHYYRNKDIDFLMNNKIIEYDIKSAGLSLAKEFKYLSDNVINKLENMSKSERNRMMGIMKINNKQLVKNENTALIEARKKFIKLNELDIEDIISIKKDAIFVHKNCRELKFGEIEFVPKNIYSSYMMINNIEFYYNKNHLDIKGINDNLLKLHNDYMLLFFKKFMCLYAVGKTNELIDFLTGFVYKYKTRNLDKEYYREFNALSMFKLNTKTSFGTEYLINYIDDENFNSIDIGYNFFKYLIPLTVMLI